MTKEFKTGAAPVSKYAAKQMANAKAMYDENHKANAETEDAVEVTTKKKFKFDLKKDKDKVKGIAPAAANYPEHIVAIALLIKNNAEIRRFTALGILNYLLQKGEIKGDSRYVSFKWNKFAVKCDGLMREYFYTEPFFINALVASFSSFSASAQRTIDAFCHKEMSIDITKAVDSEEVERIASLNEPYQHGASDDSEDCEDDSEEE